MSSDLIEAIINASTDALWAVDRAGRISFANAVAVSCFGFARPDELVGRPSHELVHHHRADGTPYPADECPVLRAVATGLCTFSHDETFWRADGTSFRADVRVTPLVDAGGVVSGAVVGFARGARTLGVERARAAVELERRNFRDLFHLTPEMVCMLSGPEHRFEFVNPAHVKALGFDATGLTVREAQPESVEVHGLLDEVYRTGETANLPEYPVTLTDRLRYFHLTYAPRRDARGDVDGIMILGREITEQVEARRRLLESEQTLREFMDAVPVQLWSSNPDGTPQFFNRFWYAYTGVRAKAHVGGEWPHVVHPEDLERVRTNWQRHVREVKPFTQEYRIRRASDQTYRWHISRGAPVLNAAGETVRWAGCTADIEDLKQAERAAESASRSKSAFLANMSHEIRTPLGAIIGFSELLREPDLSPAEREQYLATVIRNGQGLTRIIDDILDLAKVEAGRLDVEDVEFSLRDVLDESLALFRDKARQKNIYLDADVAGDLPAQVISDPTRVRQILINIIGNAVKFTTTGGIRVTARPTGVPGADGARELEVRVRDTGVGLTRAQRDKLFVPFVQADNSTTRRYGGTGLGLALSRRLAEALGGDIVILDGEPNVGCTFRVTFRVRCPEPRTRPAPELAPPPTGARLKGVRVLLAEDSLDNQYLISQVLERQGAHVALARDGEEAIQVARAGRVDVVLMDIQMPRVDGYVATRALRAIGFEAPIIALTAHAMQEEKARTRAAGCDAHLTKPLNRDELIDTIARLAERASKGEG